MRIGRRGAIGAGVLLAAAPAAAVGASFAHSANLRSSFERQFWTEGRYPTAELLGMWRGFGRLVNIGGAHCDVGGEAVYGVSDEFEPVEAFYAGRTISVGAASQLALEVEPVSDRALSAVPARTNDPDVAVRETLVRDGVDVARAQSFRTVFIVRAISWGHAPWLDWRCR